jgi:hypothetical protein
MRVKSGSESPVEGNFKLYNDCLVLVSGDRPIASSLLWKRIEPFSE